MISMQADRDFFAGLNTSILVVEFPVSDAVATPPVPLRVWATTGRHAP
jgi:hypothetical protein